jgi:hypothetical protein
MTQHDPAAADVIALALYDIMEENDRQTNEWTLGPLGVGDAVRVILSALEKHRLYIVDAEEITHACPPRT